MKILVVDDERMILTLTEKLLKQAGFEVDLAQSGKSALDIIKVEPEKFDMVLLDMTMPGLSGIETLSKIREINPDLPCILSSGHDTAEIRLPDDLALNTHFLEKPFMVGQLTAKIKEILKI